MIDADPRNDRQRCPTCGWPIGEAALLSSHQTSNGVLHYRRCTCGRLLVEIGGVEIGGTQKLADAQPTKAKANPTCVVG